MKTLTYFSSSQPYAFLLFPLWYFIYHSFSGTVPLASPCTPVMTYCTLYTQPILGPPGLVPAEVSSGDPREELFMAEDHRVWMLGCCYSLVKLLHSPIM